MSPRIITNGHDYTKMNGKVVNGLGHPSETFNGNGVHISDESEEQD